MIITIVLVVYIAMLLAVGIYTSFKAKSYSDYNLAGRSNNKWITGIATQAASTSAWMMLGLPGATFILGFQVIWILIGWMGGALLNWLIIAKRLRSASEYYNAFSMVEFFEKRTNDKTGNLGMVSGIAVIVLMTINSSAEFVACGKLLTACFGFDTLVGLLIAFVIVMIYTFLGGYLAVSWTNLIQGTMMFLALLLAPIFIIGLTGGPSIIIEKISTMAPNFFDFMDMELGFWGKMSLVTGGVGIAFMYPGYIHSLTSMMAIKDNKEMGFSAIIAIVWGMIALFGATSMGIAARALVPDIADPEQAFVVLSEMHFSVFIFALIAAGILAAILSSVCAYIIVSASAVGANILSRKAHIDERKIVVWEKVSVLLISAGAFVLAIQGGLVFTIAMFAAAGLGASFGPLVIASIYVRNINATGAIASIIAGLATVIVFHYSGWSDAYVFGVFPGWIASILAFYIGTKLTGGADQEALDQFDRYKEQEIYRYKKVKKQIA